ncbi:MAG: extracellular solute-binding protein [bacterium]|nr:extracellular solute-binding protein [bacterium]
MKILTKNTEKAPVNTEKKKQRKHKILKKQLLLGSGVLLLLLLLLFCLLPALRQTELTFSPPKTQLRVVYSEGDVRWINSIEQTVEQFMQENPDIEVQIFSPKEVENQGFADRLKAMIAQEEFYDVVELREAFAFAEAGYLAELPEELSSLIQEERMLHSPCYSIPRYTTTRGVIYNRSLFQSLGLSEPKSWQEFLVLCDRLLQAGYNPIAVGGADLWHMSFWGDYLYQNYLLGENPRELEHSQLIEALSDFRKLSQNHYIASRCQTLSDSQTAEELASESSAMLYSGPWMIGQIQDLNPKIELGFFYLSGKNGKTYMELDDSVEWGIAAESKNDPARFAAAVRFLKFFYSEGHYEQVLSNMSADSVVRRKVQIEETETRRLLSAANQENILPCDAFLGDEATPEGFRNFFNQKLQEVLWENRSLEEIAKEVKEYWEEGYAQMEK